MLRRGCVVALGAILIALGSACGEEPATASDRLTEALVRTLLPEAASVDVEVLETVARLGVRATPHDVGNVAPLPLWILTPVLPRDWPPPEGGLTARPAYEPRQVASLLADNAWSREHPGRTTLLSPEYIQAVSVEQSGDEARGVVTFGPAGGFAGTVHYEAKRANGAWAITAFALPQPDVRIVREPEGWKTASYTPPPPPLFLTLPQASRVEALPSRQELLSIFILPSGDMKLDGVLWPLATGRPDAQGATRQALIEKVGGRELAPIVAVVGDATARWQSARWILAACREGGLRTVFLAARSGADGTVGVLPVHPAEDTDRIDEVARGMDMPTLVVRLSRRDLRNWDAAYTRVEVVGRDTFDLPRGWPSDRRGADRRPYDEEMGRIRAAIRSHVAALRETTDHGEIVGVVDASSREGAHVPYEDIVQIVSALQAQGVTDLWCPVGGLPR